MRLPQCFIVYLMFLLIPVRKRYHYLSILLPWASSASLNFSTTLLIISVVLFLLSRIQNLNDMYVAILNSYILTFSSVFNFMQTSLNGFSSFLFIMVSGLTQMIPVHTRKEHTPREFMFGLQSKPQPKELVMGSLCHCSSTKCNWNVLKKIHAHVTFEAIFLFG